MSVVLKCFKIKVRMTLSKLVRRVGITSRAGRLSGARVGGAYKGVGGCRRLPGVSAFFKRGAI